MPSSSLLLAVGALLSRWVSLTWSMNHEVVSIEADQIRFLLLGDWGLYGTGGSKYSLRDRNSGPALQKKDKVSHCPG